MPERERRAIAAELTPPFTVLMPAARAGPFVFCSPHSGRVYTSEFLRQSRLDAHALRKSEDCFVDELLAGVVSLGAPLIAARFPRAYIDVNREPYELDPDLFDGPLPPFANTQSVRVIGGLGTIARIVADAEEIYRARLPVAVALERIDRLYKPFHAALATLLEETRRRFGIAILIDCHSMPSAPVGQPASARPDFVLGDRFGASCDIKLTRRLREGLVQMGHEVHVNRPYAGGFITENYGRPGRGYHALQLEINRALYLHEASFERSAGYDRLKATLTRVLGRLMTEVPGLLGGQAAAE
ncbi:MAG: N-formylglutamate amidohydrolase [Hyphomicrobiaceae bacterium]|nr:N-formylglutamate amidohydrolase [Hyphomicrobiaceae bacterium]